MDILMLYGFVFAVPARVDSEVLGELMSVWASKIQVCWLAQNTQQVGKTGGGRKAYLYGSGSADLINT